MSLHEPHCIDRSCPGCLPPIRSFDCGHRCCDERADPFHGHFLSPSDCPRCASLPEGNRHANA